MTANSSNPPGPDTIDVGGSPRGTDRRKEQSTDEAQGLTILGISGSLRYGSLNTALLRTAIGPPSIEQGGGSVFPRPRTEGQESALAEHC